MKVKELMTKNVLTVTPDDKVDRVFFLFHFESIRHLPVMEKGKLVGILSDRDLKKVVGSRKAFVEKPDGSTLTLLSRKVKNIMRRGVITIGPEQRAAAAAIMAKRKIGALPVLEKGKLVGIITATDILRAFVKLCNDLEQVVVRR
ncbi:MAG: CBS domain-containing protein [Bacteroidota bacterium]